MAGHFDIYRGKRVLVTGHTGFKGSWLALMLRELGAEVHGYALQPPTQPNLFDDAKVEPALASHHLADIRDHERLAKTLREVKPEFVFHLAAQPIVLQSYQNPRETYEVNVMGTINLLEAVRGAGSVRVCQIITSDKCYDNREWVFPYREVDPMGGSDPYSNSKGCAELVVASYRKSFFPVGQIAEHGVSLASVRAGNVIGGGDWAESRIIPDCIRALQKGEPIEVRDPDAVRPWQHVLEPLSGYLQLAAGQWREPAKFAEAWNFGPALESQVPVRRVVERVIAEWGTGSWKSTQPGGPRKESFMLKLDITKATSLLGWWPKLTFDEAIAWTVKGYREQTSAGDTCLAQIREYQKRG
jgi:CDP-glucose 4,6-dehydratase